MRKLSGTQVASLTAIVIAAIVAVFFEPLPPLLQAVHSEAWTRLTEWFGVSLGLLVLLSWMGVTAMEFEVTSSGIKSRRIPADGDLVEELRKELLETREDLRRLHRVNRQLWEALLSGAAVGINPDAAKTEVDDDA